MGNDLANRMNDAAKQGGGIKPGTRPDPGDTPFDAITKVATRVGTFVNGALNRMNSTGSHRSPTTVQDKGHKPAAKPAAPSFTGAQEDSILKKYGS